ncbi:hypothetical protein PO124_02000 [Bacillus licheniformis]|nr:hypothetical protein [Bacillus licheniformis]
MLLTIITSGIYIPYWFLSRRKNLERCQIKLPYVAIKVTLLLSVFQFGAFWTFIQSHFKVKTCCHTATAFASPAAPRTQLSPAALIPPFWTVNLYSAFKVRKAFIGLSEKQVNGFWTFILNVSYLQYITNQHSLVVQEKEKQYKTRLKHQRDWLVFYLERTELSRGI